MRVNLIYFNNMIDDYNKFIRFEYMRSLYNMFYTI